MAWLLNMVLPGTGLIIRRREWLGVALALVFGICGNVALAGSLIAPVAIPPWLTRLAGLLAACAWLLSQWLFRRQGILHERRAGRLAILLRDASAALEADDVEAARACLESGLALDDENVELQLLCARLMERLGKDREARKAWRRVLKLDGGRAHQSEAHQALANKSTSC